MPDSDPKDDTRTHVILSRGDMVSHYRILGRVGAGGMGDVYLAADTRLDRQVAIKFISAHRALEADVHARFTREAQAAAKLDHPNIVTIHEVGEFKNQPFLVMQYVDGKPLSHYCQNAPLTLEQIAGLAIQIAEGLARAHGAGVTHRDIKPANIIVDHELRPKILDFGLAAVSGAQPLTQTGSTLGTVAYMSPEQAQGRPADHRSDLFSFGVVLYELIAGRNPFKRESDAATLHAIVHDDPEPLVRFRANVPDELQRIVSRLLQRDPALRVQTASDARADLRRLASSDPAPRVLPAATKRSPLRVYAFALGGVALTALAVYLLRTEHTTLPPMAGMRITSITSDGKVTSAAISPEGSYLAYLREESGLTSLWVQHLSTGSRVQIVEATDVPLRDVTFSPDGGYVYYRRMLGGDLGDLWRTPVLGGSPHHIVANVWSQVAFSPDGSRIAFHRFMVSAGTMHLLEATSDGTGERNLITTAAGDDDYYFASPAWSQDGKFIAMSKNSMKPTSHTLLAILDATTGHELSLISGDWSQALSIGWLPAGGLVVASRHRSNPFGGQIWKVVDPGGTLNRITNDLNNYGDLSLTSDGTRLVAIQTDTRAGIWLVPMENTRKGVQVLHGKYDGVGGVTWADPEDFVFFSGSGNAIGLHRYSLAQGKTALITKGSPIVYSPSVSRDGRAMVFMEMGERFVGISICAPDGSGRRNLTAHGEYFMPDLSADAQWAVYLDGSKGYPRIMRVAVEGGEPTAVGDTTRPCFVPRISPDGRWIACYSFNESVQRFRIAIFPSEGGSPAHTLEVSPTAEAGFTELAWSPDGSSILYLELKAGVNNIWSQPVEGGPPSQITFYEDLYINDFDLSRDGKQLVICRSVSTSDAVMLEGF